jgi:hypothetical protein
MSLGTSEKRAERPDTKTLVRLGGDFEPNERVPTAPAIASEGRADAASEPALDADHVELWLKGVREPVRVRAERVPGGLRLRTPLPFLELDSVVGIAAPVDGLPEHGRVRRVRIEHGSGSQVPELSVELSLSDAVVLADDARLDPTAPRITTREPAPGSEQRTAPWRGPWLGLAIGAALGSLLTFGASSLRPREAPRSSPAPQRVAAAPTPPTPPGVTPAAEAQAARAMETDPALPFIVVDEPAFEPAVADAVTDSAAQVTATETETRVLVPMRGDSRELRTYELSTPGVAVTLPHAQALGTLGNHRIVRGLVRRVWLLPVGSEGMQVRVITRRPATRTSVSYDEAGLHITLGH